MYFGFIKYLQILQFLVLVIVSSAYYSLLVSVSGLGVSDRCQFLALLWVSSTFMN